MIVWTGPNDGAVRVTNSRGWLAMDSGVRLPPTRPLATTIQASVLYKYEHDGQTTCRRSLHATRSWLSLISPVARFNMSPRRRIGCEQLPAIVTSRTSRALSSAFTGGAHRLGVVGEDVDVVVAQERRHDARGHSALGEK